MKIREINLKKYEPTVELAIANMLIEIDIAKLDGTPAIKFIHGYGSHGTGGAICLALRNKLKMLKKQKIIIDYLNGGEWNLYNKKCTTFLEKYHIEPDSDLNNNNSGITIVIC